MIDIDDNDEQEDSSKNLFIWVSTFLMVVFFVFIFVKFLYL